MRQFRTAELLSFPGRITAFFASEKSQFLEVVKNNFEVLITLMRSEPVVFWARIVYSALSIASGLLLSYAIGALVNMGAKGQFGGGIPAGAWIWIGAFMACLIFLVWLPAVRPAFEGKLELWARRTYDLQVIRKFFSMDGMLQQSPQHETLQHIVRDRAVTRIQQFVKSSFGVLEALVNLAASTLILLPVQPVLWLITVLCFAPLSLCEIAYVRRFYQLEHEQRPRQRVTEVLRWYVTHLVILPFAQSLNVFPYVEDKFSATVRELERERMQMESRYLLLRFALTAAGVVGPGLCVIYMAQQAFAGQMTWGAFVFLSGACGAFGRGVGALSQELGSQYAGSLGLSAVKEFVALEPAVKYPEIGPVVSIKQPLAVKAEDLWFAYPRRQGCDARMVLKGVSFEARPGDTVVVMGENGAGKSTLFGLLTRRFDPLSGSISFGGHSIKSLTEPMLREVVGALPQEFQLYELTVRELLSVSRFGREDVDDADIWWALRMAGANDFVDKYAGGLNEQLGIYRGGLLPSLGQQQALACSQVFCKRSPVVLLDEPTAKMDSCRAAKLLNNLSKLNATVIIITHDFRAAQLADQILLMEHGQIAACGNHKELLSISAEYEKMYESWVGGKEVSAVG